MSADSPCPKCKAKVKAGTKFCPYCMVKLEVAREPEFVGAPVEPPPVMEIAPRREGTGEDDLLAAGTHVLGGAPEFVAQRGLVLQGYALWKRDDHLVLLTLGFSELGRTPEVWPESGRGFELLLRIKGSTVPPWIFPALDGLLEHTFKVGAGTPVRLVPTLWCETVAVEGLDYLDTVNGALRVIEVVSPFGPIFSADDNELSPPLPPDDASRRTQLLWRLDHDGDVSEYSLCGDTVVLDGKSERCHDHKYATERLREELERALQSRARVSRVVHERPARRSLQATHSPLEAEFLLARDDVKGARVYRDWLLEHGDPRGELAAWHDAGAREELDFFWHHDASAVLGEFAPHLPVAQFKWTCGFIDSCLVVRRRPSHRDYSQIVSGVLGLPFLATVRGLRLECQIRSELVETWNVLASAPQAPRLTTLSLNEDGPVESPELSWTRVGELGPLLSALPSLEELRVRATSGSFGALDNPRLQKLTIESTELTELRVKELTTAKAPLTALELWTGGECDVSRIEPLFMRRGLTSFGLVNCAVAQEALPILVRSPIFETLRTLSFSGGALIDEDVPVILAAAPSLKKLERFDVDDNGLSAEALRTLRRVLPNLVSESQREAEEGERYVSVAE